SVAERDERQDAKTPRRMIFLGVLASWRSNSSAKGVDMTQAVSQEELNRLGADGYFIRRNLLPAEDVAIVKKTIEDALDAPTESRKGNFDPELKARQADAKFAERERYRKLGQFARNTPEIIAHGIGHPNIL